MIRSICYGSSSIPGGLLFATPHIFFFCGGEKRRRESRGGLRWMVTDHGRPTSVLYVHEYLQCSSELVGPIKRSEPSDRVGSDRAENFKIVHSNR